MSERRQVPRYKFNGVALLSQTAGGPSASITLVTISVCGFGTGSVVALNVGQKGVLTMEWQGRLFRTEVQVAWKKPKGGAGFRFLAVDQENLAILRDICRSHPLEPLTKLAEEPDKIG